jgi:hypothetical protein
MMKCVHLERIQASQPGKEGTLGHCHGMVTFLADIVVAVMLDGTGVLGLDMLKKGTTEDYIDDLETAANSEYGYALFEAGFQENRFDLIAFVQNFFRFRELGFTKKPGVYVISPAEKDPVQFGDQGCHLSWGKIGRQDQGDSTRMDDGLGVFPRQAGMQIFKFDGAVTRCDSDQRL